jgi:hypothetical protein
MRQKPGDTIPTADEFRIIANPVRKSLTLMFRTPGPPTAVEVPVALLAHVLGAIAHTLAAWPEKDASGLVQLLAIREVSARLHGLLPTLDYTLEMGLHLQQSIDLADARRLHSELGAILAHLSDGSLH